MGAGIDLKAVAGGVTGLTAIMGNAKSMSKYDWLMTVLYFAGGFVPVFATTSNPVLAVVAGIVAAGGHQQGLQTTAPKDRPVKAATVAAKTGNESDALG